MEKACDVLKKVKEIVPNLSKIAFVEADGHLPRVCFLRPLTEAERGPIENMGMKVRHCYATGADYLEYVS